MSISNVITRAAIKVMPLASVANGIKDAYSTHIETDLKTIVNDVVLPGASIILIVALVIRAAMMFIKFRQGEEVGWKFLIGAFIGLIITTTAKSWMWGII